MASVRMSFLSLPRWMQPAPDSAVAERMRSGQSPYVAAIHLLWSFWLFITPLFGGGYSGDWLLLTLLSYPLFLWLFAMTLLAPRRGAYVYPLAMAVLSLLLLARYPSGISYFIYGCVMLRRRHWSLGRYLGWLAVLNIAFMTLAWSSGYPWQMMLYIPITAFVIGIIINVERVAHEKDAALRLSQDEVRRIAATAERERIGRDLHDLLGHTLSLITLKLELSRKLIDRDPVAARRELGETEKVARKALAEVRSAVTGIRATSLAAELAAARLMLESSHVHLKYGALPADVPESVEGSLALVLREAVTNMARHAEASRAQVDIRKEDGMLHMIIADNGRGGVREDGNGLRGMRERIGALDGRLQIQSPRGEGTCIHIEVPLRVYMLDVLQSTDEPLEAGETKPCTQGQPQ
jgi:two-component system sensor histidine kinase DesK